MNEAVTSTTTKNPYHVQLEVFEGPLDLLLHLIKESEIDIYDIPVSRITDQYLEYIEVMKSLNLDVAGEFLVMAATLAHIKSKMLLPKEEFAGDPEEEGVDPREELMRRLLEYQKFKNAAQQLIERPVLYRDVFKRERIIRPKAPPSSHPAELVEVSVFTLVEAFHAILEKARLEEPHDVESESVRVSDCMQDVAQAVRNSREGTIQFEELFQGEYTRRKVVVTFFAILEMLKRGLISVLQREDFAPIQLIGTPDLYGDWNDDPTFFDSIEISS